jgi:hypothetical protein
MGDNSIFRWLPKYMIFCAFEYSPSIPSFLVTKIVYIGYGQLKKNDSFSFYLSIYMLLVFLYLKERFRYYNFFPKHSFPFSYYHKMSLLYSFIISKILVYIFYFFLEKPLKFKNYRENSFYGSKKMESYVWEKNCNI